MANSLPFWRRPEPCLQLVPPLDTPRRDWPAGCQDSPATPNGITLAARIAARPSPIEECALGSLAPPRTGFHKSASRDHGERFPEVPTCTSEQCPNAPRRVRQRKGLLHLGHPRGAAFRTARRASCRNMHPATVTETPRSLMNARQPVTYPCLIRQG